MNTRNLARLMALVALVALLAFLGTRSLRMQQPPVPEVRSPADHSNAGAKIQDPGPDPWDGVAPSAAPPLPSVPPPTIPPAQVIANSRTPLESGLDRIHMTGEFSLNNTILRSGSYKTFKFHASKDGLGPSRAVLRYSTRPDGTGKQPGVDRELTVDEIAAWNSSAISLGYGPTRLTLDLSFDMPRAATLHEVEVELHIVIEELTDDDEPLETGICSASPVSFRVTI